MLEDNFNGLSIIQYINKYILVPSCNHFFKTHIDVLNSKGHIFET